MAAIRKIKLLITNKPVIEGAGVHLNRVFGFNNEQLFDPFLLLDDFRSDSPADYIKGFPWHPHRGIETITYVLKGDVEHGDSLGNSGMISSGDVQWMTAGSGIIHQEMPQGDRHGSMHGFQLWANLPADCKMIQPHYRDIVDVKIPRIEQDNGVTIKIIAGTVDGISGPVSDIVINPQYLDCSIPAGTTFKHPVIGDYTAFIYVIGGTGIVDQKTVSNGMLVLFEEGDAIEIIAEDEPLRCLLLVGKPLKEPIAWRGPIVMNTQAELELAFQEYQDGTFIKHQ